MQTCIPCRVFIEQVLTEMDFISKRSILWTFISFNRAVKNWNYLSLVKFITFFISMCKYPISKYPLIKNMYSVYYFAHFFSLFVPV